MKILVLHASALQAGYLGAYGSDWVATPHLDRFAAEGIVFDRHIADWPKRHGIAESYLTGRYRFPLPSGSEPEAPPLLLAKTLQAHDIEPLFLDATGSAAALATHMKRWARREHGLCWLSWPSLAPPWSVPDDFLDAYFSETEDDEPLTPWFDPPTGPFDDEGPDRERLQNTYAARVSFLDAEIGALIDKLRDQSLLEKLMVVFTASSGLPLGEHGHVGAHRAWLHEELVHLPLIVRMPGAAEAGRRLPALTQPVDLLPAILAGLHLPPLETQGVNFLPLIGEDGSGEADLRAAAPKTRSHAFSGLALGDSVEWAVRTPEWAFLLPLSTPPDDPPRQPQLFVKPDDRWEVNDVRHQNIEVTEELEGALRTFVAETCGKVIA